MTPQKMDKLSSSIEPLRGNARFDSSEDALAFLPHEYSITTLQATFHSVLHVYTLL